MFDESELARDGVWSGDNSSTGKPHREQARSYSGSRWLLLLALDLNQPALNEPQVAVHAVVRAVDPGFNGHGAVFELAIGGQCRRGYLAFGRWAAVAQDLHGQITFINQRAVAAH